MKIIEKQWFIERIKPYLMPGESIREGRGCVIFTAPSKKGDDCIDRLYIHAPTGLASHSKNAVYHLELLHPTAIWNTMQPLTPHRCGKDSKEQLLADFLAISGLEGRDLEACRRARTRKKIVFSGMSMDKAALEAEGHTVTCLTSYPDQDLVLMKNADAFVYYDCHEEEFNLGMAYVLDLSVCSTDDMPKLLEILDK